MRKIVVWAAIGALALSGIHCLGSSQAGYPLAPDVEGSMGVLARADPEVLTRVSAQDVERLSRAFIALDAAIYQAEHRQELLATEKIETLRSDQRESIREVWADLFEPLMMIENLKERYRFFWTIDYQRNPRLHSRAFGIAYAAMCAEVEAGQRLFSLIGAGKVAPILFDEEMANRGVPRGSFLGFRMNLSNAVEQGWVTSGHSWYDTWIKKHLGDGGMNAELSILIKKRFEGANAVLGFKATMTAAQNSAELMAGEAFRRFLPAQKNVAEWLGDTRVVPQDRRLISDAQIEEMKKSMRPGDVIVERRNWYLSNIGLPGFWPHAALYVGTVEDLRKTFDDDPDVQARFGRFTEHLQKNRAEAFATLAKKDDQGHPHSVIEAVSEGVVIASLEHSCGADYVGVLRPRMPLVDVASAIDKAFSYFGRPYDFNFDFGTDDQLVCSELVLKSYEPRTEKGPGLRIPYLVVAGRRVGLPTEIVRQFGAEQGTETRQLDFVYFLDGREKGKNALVGDAKGFAESVNRPKWDVAQE
jgi:Permuted papain-like amidase enzyme, YaeF/YiiX, C92 family